jgi:hypothetical protein
MAFTKASSWAFSQVARSAPFAQVGGLAEDASQEAPRGLQHAGDGAYGRRLEAGAEARAAAVAVELELESRLVLWSE